MLGRFNYCQGNHFELLVDGDQCVGSMLEAIAEADQYILIEHYLVESGVFVSTLIDALLAAADRGVAVYILMDDFGSAGLSTADCNRLRHPRISVEWYNPLHVIKWYRNFNRDHRKLIVVDHRAAFVGGFCITDKFWAGARTAERQAAERQAARLPWLDVALRIQGPIVNDWRELFARTWSRASSKALVLPLSTAVQVGQMTGRVAWANGHLHQGILREFLTRARKASRVIYIATPYLAPSWRIRRTLIRAAKRGTDVRLLIPGPETDHPGVRFAAWRYYKKLLRNGIRIFEYQPRFIHAKIVLCDDWVSIGSWNLDHWNQRWNLEANQEVIDDDFSGNVEAFFHAKFEEAEEQQLRDWIRPYWRRRMLAYFWGRVDAWLMRL